MTTTTRSGPPGGTWGPRLAGFGATASGSDSPAAVLAFWAAVTAALAWLSAVSVYAYRHAAA